MDTAVWLPLLSGFAGAIIGAGASIATATIQSRKDDRRERVRLIVELAKIDHSLSIDILKSGRRGGLAVPLPIFIAYYMDLMNAIGEGEISPERYAEIRDKNKLLIATLEDPPP